MFGRPVEDFDWLAPDYSPFWDMRIRALAKLRGDPVLLAESKAYYAENVADFVNDWGVTVNPNNAGTAVPVVMPFLLFDKQLEYLQWLDERRRTKDSGVLVKSRDCGASWLAMSYACWLCLFYPNAAVGFGSHKEEQVDNAGDPGALFGKGRMFMKYLPPEFKTTWSENNRLHSGQRKLMFPWNESAIMGRSGDNIGVGDRTTLFIVDEFAAIERSKLVEANLIATSECRVEMSTVKGLSNVFAEHARGGKMTRFDFHYRDDPRKCFRDEHGQFILHEWFAKKKRDTDPIIWNEQYECDFLASAEGIIIPKEWVQACIGAASFLGIEVTGERRAAYDVADQGKDKNCLGFAYGVELQHMESWSGSNSTIGKSVLKVYGECEGRKVSIFDYDGDGMGAGVRSDAERIESDRAEQNRPLISASMFRGSAAVQDPENFCPGTDRLNKDFFENYKAQSWWALRQRAYLTWQAVMAKREGRPFEFDPSDILSISPDMPELTKTADELSQPVWTWSKSGKMMIDKTPDDVASPNNGDCVMMLFPYARPPMQISAAILEMFGHGSNPEQSFGEQSFGSSIPR
jgi:hypothetical protein